MQPIRFGRVVYPLDPTSSARPATMLAQYYREKKGIQADVVTFNEQHFVVTGKDLLQYRTIQTQYQTGIAKLQDSLDRVLFGFPGSGVDWSSVGVGVKGYGHIAGAVAIAQKMEKLAEETKEKVRELIKKPQLWRPQYPLSQGRPQGQIYNGPLKRDIVTTLTSDAPWTVVKDNIDKAARHISNEEFAKKQPSPQA